MSPPRSAQVRCTMARARTPSTEPAMMATRHVAPQQVASQVVARLIAGEAPFAVSPACVNHAERTRIALKKAYGLCTAVRVQTTPTARLRVVRAVNLVIRVQEASGSVLQAMALVAARRRRVAGADGLRNAACAPCRHAKSRRGVFASGLFAFVRRRQAPARPPSLLLFFRRRVMRLVETRRLMR